MTWMTENLHRRKSLAHAEFQRLRAHMSTPVFLFSLCLIICSELDLTQQTTGAAFHFS